MKHRIGEAIRLAAAAQGQARWERVHTGWLESLRPVRSGPALHPPSYIAGHTHPLLRVPMFVGGNASATALYASDTTTATCAKLGEAEIKGLELPAGITPYGDHGITIADYGANAIVSFDEHGNRESMPLPLQEELHPVALCANDTELYILSATDDMTAHALHLLGADGTLLELPPAPLSMPRTIAILGDQLLLTCEGLPTIYSYAPRSGAANAWGTDPYLVPATAVASRNARTFVLRGTYLEERDESGNVIAGADVAELTGYAGTSPVSLAVLDTSLLIGDQLNQCVHQLSLEA